MEMTKRERKTAGAMSLTIQEVIGFGVMSGKIGSK